ncbi:MAG: hypothetical protein IKZ43_07315 [Acidaminococcaceae bacterium]|nr:hypothetical protein [Acidaminococcaceae bacterium]
MFSKEQLQQINDEIAGLRPISPLPAYRSDEADDYGYTPEATAPEVTLPKNWGENPDSSGDLYDSDAYITGPKKIEPNYEVLDFLKTTDKVAGRVETMLAANQTAEMDAEMETAGKRIDAWKLYTNSRPDLLREVKEISIETGIPEETVLHSSETLNKARGIYNYSRKQLALMQPGTEEVSIKELAKAYPGLENIINNGSLVDAAIALENIENIRQMHGIFDAGITGWKKGQMQRRMDKVGMDALSMLRDPSKEELQQLENLRKEYMDMREAPDFFDDPLVSIVGRTAEQAPQQAWGLAKGTFYGGAAAATAVGATVLVSVPTGGASLAMAPAALRTGFSWGMRFGYMKDMFEHSAARRYMEYTQFKNEKGDMLLTNEEAAAYAVIAAGVETGIEFANADLILKVLKGNKSVAAAQIRNILSGTKDTASMLAAFKKILAGAGEVTISESVEEGFQTGADMALSNVAHAIWGGNIPKYSIGDILKGSAEDFVEALIPSFGFGVTAAGSGSFSVVNRAARLAEIREKGLTERLKNITGTGMIRMMEASEGITSFFKKDPDVAKKVMHDTVQGSGYENVHVDTDLVKQQEGGTEALKELGKKAGLDEGVVQTAIDTGADLTVPTEVYFQTKMETEEGKFAIGEDYISFSETDRCFARNQKVAELWKADARNILDEESVRREEARLKTIDNILARDFKEGRERDAVAEILMVRPDNVKEGWSDLRKTQQRMLDEILDPIVKDIQEFAEKGAESYRTPDGKVIYYSNNAEWYRKFLQDYGRKPTKEEYRQFAIDALTGKDFSKHPSLQRGMISDEQFAENAEAIFNLQQNIAALDAIKDRISGIDLQEMELADGMSKEAYDVYRNVSAMLAQESKNQKVKKSARAGAALMARHADRFAEAMRKASGNEYTASDYFRDRLGIRIGGTFESGGEATTLFQVSPAEFNRQKEKVRKLYIGSEQWMKAPNGKPTNLTEDQWVTVRTPAFKNWFGHWDFVDSAKRIVALSPIEVTVNDANIEKKDAEEKVKQYNGITHDETGTILTFPNSFVGKVRDHKGFPVLSILDSLPVLFKSSIPIPAMPEEIKPGHKIHNNILGYYNYVNKFRVGESTYYIRFTAFEENRKKRTKDRLLHSTAISDVVIYKENEKGTSPDRFWFSDPGVKEQAPFTDIILSRILNSVKDSSKVVDENGEPKVLYHQTNNTFDTFDVKRQGAGTNDSETPYGIFMKPDDKDIGLGSIQMPLFANIRNPLAFKDRSEVNQWLKDNVSGYKVAAEEMEAKLKDFNTRYEEADAKDDEEYARIYNEYKEGKITEEEYEEQKSQLLEHGEADKILKEWTDYEAEARHNLKNMLDAYMRQEDYDGMTLKEDAGSGGRSVSTTIAFEPNQIKDASGRNVGYDPDNDNIYFQTADNEPVTPMDKLKADAAAWGKTIDDLMNGTLTGDYIRVMDTPLALTLGGAKRLPIEIKHRNLHKIILGKHQNQFTPYLAKQIPEALTNPLAIFFSDSIQGQKNIVVAVELKDKNGSGIIVPFRLNEITGAGGYEVNIMTSAYGKDATVKNPKTGTKSTKPRYEWFYEQIRNGNAKYINKKKLASLLNHDERLMALTQQAINELHSALRIADEIDLVKLKQDNPEYYQRQQRRGNKIQGSTGFDATGRRIISIFNSADESTMAHELGHVFLEDLKELAGMENALEQVKKDWETIKNWLGWKPDQEQLTREQHEKFARGFEAYLMNGEAPASGLIKIFRKFKTWLTKLYKDFLYLGGLPSVEVQQVMNRMLATEEEVEAAFRLREAESFEKAGGFEFVEPDSKAMYKRWRKKAREYAREKVLTRAIGDLRKAQQESIKERRKALTAAAEAELREEPLYIAEALVKNNPAIVGMWPADSLGITYEEYQKEIKERGDFDTAVNRAVRKGMKEYLENISEEKLREDAEKAVDSSKYRGLCLAFEYQYMRRMNVGNEQMNRDINERLQEVEKAAAESGQETTENEKLQEAVRKLQSAGIWNKSELNAIKKMKEAKNKNEALAAANEFRKIRRQTSQAVRVYRDSVINDTKLLKKYAEETMAGMPLKEATNVAKWRALERTCAEESAAYMKKAIDAQLQYSPEGDVNPGELWEKATEAKKRQRIFAEYAALAQKNKEKLERRNAKLLARQKTIQRDNNIPANERYMYNHGLFVLGLSKQDAQKPSDSMSILSMFQGYAGDLSAFFVDEFGNISLPDYIIAAMAGNTVYKDGYSGLTMEQYDYFYDMLGAMYKSGLDANKIKATKDAEGNTVMLRDVCDSIALSMDKRVPEIQNADTTNAGSPTLRQKVERKARAARVELTKIETVLEWMGPEAVQYLYDPVNRAWEKKTLMMEEAEGTVKGMLAAYSDEEKSEMRSKKQFRFGTSVLTKEEVICLALNWGTELNRKRVLDGYSVSEKQVRELLKNLTQKDWQLVTSIWELVNSYWPETVKVEEEMAGVAPEKQTAMPFEIVGKDGNAYKLMGGYYPIQYDPAKSSASKENQQNDAARQGMMGNAAMARRRGFTKTRVQTVKDRPLLLSLDVLNKHLDEVIHNICFRIPLRDVLRILRDPLVKSEIESRFGQDQWLAMHQWAQDCWAPEPGKKTMFDSVREFYRNKRTTSALAYRVTTSVMNSLNYFPMIDYLGFFRANAAIRKFYAHPKDGAEFVMSRSVFMRQRAETMDRDVGEVLRKNFVGGYGKHLDKVVRAEKAMEANAFKLLAWTDLALAIPLWTAEYERVFQEKIEAAGKEINRNSDRWTRIEVEASEAGDRAVRKVFGSGEMKDLAPVQKDKMMKEVTMFYSYFNVVFNALYEGYGEGRRLAKESGTAYRVPGLIPFAGNKEIHIEIGPLLEKYLYWIVLTGLAGGLEKWFFDWSSGNDDDDKTVFGYMVREVGDNTFGMIPLLRDAGALFLDRLFGERYYGAPTIPIYDSLNQANKLWSATTSERKTKIDVFRESARISNSFTGIGNTVTDAIATTAYWADTDFDTPFWQYLSAVLFDKRIDRKKK